MAKIQRGGDNGKQTPANRTILQEAFRFRPFPHWDPVPDWVLSHLDPRVLRQIAVIQMKVQRNGLEQQAKALGEIEKLLG